MARIWQVKGMVYDDETDDYLETILVGFFSSEQKAIKEKNQLVKDYEASNDCYVIANITSFVVDKVLA